MIFRIMIETIKEINTVNEDFPQRYGVDLKDDYALSILTGSHIESAELGTLEIALMCKQNHFAFGVDEPDDSIIHYIKPDKAEEMLREMRASSSDSYKDIFKKYQTMSYES